MNTHNEGKHYKKHPLLIRNLSQLDLKVTQVDDL